MTKNQEHPSALLTEKEAAELLHLCPRALIGWRNRGLVPYIRIGRSIRYRLESLTSLLEKLEIGGANWMLEKKTPPGKVALSGLTTSAT
jgi:transposase